MYLLRATAMWACLVAVAFSTPAAAQQSSASDVTSPPAAGSQNALVLDATKLDPHKCQHVGPYVSCQLKVADGTAMILKFTPKQFNALTK